MISLLGCSGVGKTRVIDALAQKLNQQHPVEAVQVLSENIQEVLAPLKSRVFFDDYERFIATQKAFMERDIKALGNAGPWTLFDNRLAEYVFYLLHHPEFKDRGSESRRRLNPQLSQLLGGTSVRAFYLSDSLENIREKVRSDTGRTRRFWPFFVEHMLPFHQDWHQQQGATLIDVTDKTPEAIADHIIALV